MAKNFKKENSSFENAKATESILAKQDVIKVIPVEKINEYAYNNEDITQLDDLISSMELNGFIDPIEVTTYGCDDGKYMILSGHRRFTAWKKLHDGKQPIKCIIIDAAKFQSDVDVREYVLMANSHRDSAKDPLLLMRRCKEHIKIVEERGHKNVREEVSKRMGLSVPQVDRYIRLSKCTSDVLDLVKEELIGISTALGASTLSEEEQRTFALVIKDAIADKQYVNRDFAPKITRQIREGKTTWNEIKNVIAQKDIPNSAMMQLASEDNRTTEADIAKIGETEAEKNPLRPDEVRVEKSNNNNDSEDAALPKTVKNASTYMKMALKLDYLVKNEFFDFEDKDAAIELTKQLISALEEYVVNA